MTSRTNPQLLVEERGAAVWLTMNRPQSLNGINPQIIAGLDAALDEIEARREPPSAIVLTGTGRAFCTGGEMKDMEDGQGGYRSAVHIFSNVSRVIRRMEQLPIPVIGAINGLCIARGIELALGCDLVIAVKSARFGDGHANFGLIPGAGGTVRLPRRIGLNRARLMMYTAKLFPAETMFDWGLVTDVCEDDALEAAVEKLVSDLAKKSPRGLALMKSLTAAGEATAEIDAALAHEIDVCVQHDASKDRAEGLAAFAQKRKPKFVGG